MTHLTEVLRRLREAGLTVKPSKCHLAMAECIYLGHAVGSGVMKPVADKLQAVDQFPQPTTKKHVRSFLGLTGYYCRFIPHYATITAPLCSLTKKSEPDKVNWTAECGKPFNKLKEVLFILPCNEKS